MEKTQAVAMFECLSSAVRLDVFRLLMRHAPDGLVAGDIAAALDIAPNNLSFHLKALAQADLVSVEQQGRFQRYRANIDQMHDLAAYLTDECCAGHPEQCAASTPAPTAAAHKTTFSS